MNFGGDEDDLVSYPSLFSINGLNVRCPLPSRTHPISSYVWPPVGRAVLEGCKTSREWSLTGEGESTGVELEV